MHNNVVTQSQDNEQDSKAHTSADSCPRHAHFWQTQLTEEIDVSINLINRQTDRPNSKTNSYTS